MVHIAVLGIFCLLVHRKLFWMARQMNDHDERYGFDDSLFHADDVANLQADLSAMTKKADGFFDALQLAAKINAEGQAREQQLREALKALQQGFPQTHQINAVIRHALVTPQDDTALRQWGAKLLRGMAEMDCFNDYMRERINRKAAELREGK